MFDQVPKIAIHILKNSHRAVWFFFRFPDEMDAYVSIIQNNQNIVFKIMTAVTIIMSLPTIISGFFGMNVAIPYENDPNAFLYILIFSIFIMIIIAYIFKKRNWL